MKLVIVVALALVAVALAHPAVEDAAAQILRSEFSLQPEGGYLSSFETDHGIIRQETGELKEVLDDDNKPQQVVVMRGSYQYNDAEGKPVVISYTADETGYHPEGDSIPKRR